MTASANERLPSESMTERPTVPVSKQAFYLYFLRLGAFGFGGPIALAGFMQRDLVERRNWISRQDYLDGLALAQLAPGPLAAQLAMYLGYVKAGFTGATIVWLFLAAGIVAMVASVWRPAQADLHKGRMNGLVVLSLPAGAVATSLVPSLPNLFWVFAKAGAFVFGSGLAIVPFCTARLFRPMAG